MGEKIVVQGAGYMIVRTDEASTSVPYDGHVRESGDVNHGWLDLRDHPEYVIQVPEAEKSPGLARFLRAIADPVSKVMSSACECGAFERAADEPDEPAWHVGGFVVMMFRDAERNTDPQELIELASYLLRGVAPTDVHHISFTFIVEPLRLFFDRGDCHALMVKANGFGASEAAAWASFEYAVHALATSLERGRPKTGLSAGG